MQIRRSAGGSMGNRKVYNVQQRAYNAAYGDASFFMSEARTCAVVIQYTPPKIFNIFYTNVDYTVEQSPNVTAER